MAEFHEFPHADTNGVHSLPAPAPFGGQTPPAPLFPNAHGSAVVGGERQSGVNSCDPGEGGVPAGSDVFAELSPPYSTIVADPPWRFGAAATKADASKHYSTMSTADICAMPVANLAADAAHLWLWAINGMMEDGYQVVRSWGFRPITLLTWCKSQPGVGHYLRNNTEHCIFATRGKPMVPAVKPMATWFLWARGAHSAKPAGFYDVVQKVSPGPYVELFCRAPILGWDSWGKGYEIGEAS